MGYSGRRIPFARPDPTDIFAGMETTLIALLGTSPGILTETVWALATEASGPVVVDRVVVITTLEGQSRAVAELMTPDANYGGRTVWEALEDALATRGIDVAGKLRFGPASIRVFPRPDDRGHLEDIRTAEDNELAADFILKEVKREIAEDVTLIGSVAGGRKTMSTLLYAVFSLLGRPQDRLTHVLVNDPFESPGLAPRFYFPCSPPLLHRGSNREGRGGIEARSDEARLTLADMPFVRLRSLFQRDFDSLPSRFTRLVEKVNEEGKPAARIPIKWDDASGNALVDGTSLKLAGSDHALMDFVVSRALQGNGPIMDRAQAPSLLQQHCQEWKIRHAALRYLYMGTLWWREFSEEEMRKSLSRLRGKLNRASAGGRLGDLALPRGGPVGFDLTHVAISLAS